MLTKLEVWNFQGHLHSLLEFVPGVNVIFGMPRQGKTSVLRAIRWWATNRPMGGNYFTNLVPDGGVVKVEVKPDDYPPIALSKRVRYNKDGEKSADNATYSIGEDIFKGVGREIPDVISRAINFSGINMQGQLEGPFLIASPPGEVGKVINKFTKLEEADAWTSSLTTKINSTNKEIEVLKRQVKEKSEQVLEYDYLPEMEERVQRLVTVEGMLLGLKKTRESLEQALSKYSDITSRIEETQKLLEVEGVVNALLDIRTKIEQSEREKELLEELVQISLEISTAEKFLTSEELVESLLSTSKSLEELERESEVLETSIVDLGNFSKTIKEKEALLVEEKVVEDLYSISSRLEESIKYYKSLSEKKERWGDLEREEGEVEKVLTTLNSEYRKILSDMKVCPYCFSEIDETKIDIILRRSL